ncbi:NAD(P)H-hydrate dehydratase [bacterium]|nr:MAG: NAD(P)H-hydrate dehydratase [bacterium]
MKKIVTPQDMQEIDRRTIQDYKISGEVLMECAGAAVFGRIRVLFAEYTSKNIFVFCGKGNNGGDGFVIARYLKENGAAPKVFVTGSMEDVKMDARIHFNKLIAGGVQPIFISNGHDLGNEKPDIIVDALLGTGARGSLDGELLNLVEKINAWRNQQGCYVLSVDIPSGMNGETGRVENAAVKADATVTMGLPKSGLLFGDGKHYTGKLYVADIGFPDELTRGDKFVLIEKEDVRKLLKPRRHNAYKYDFGKVLIIAGSRGMSGAAFLAAKSALRIGAGLVKVAIPEGVAHVIEHALPEAMTLRLEETKEGSPAYRNRERLIDYMNWADVTAIGPGLSQHDETIQLIQEIVQQLKKPAVIDADAVTALAGKSELISSVASGMVFTPHIGEFAVLSNVVKEKIVLDRIDHLRHTSRKLNKTILLKGSPTLIAAADGRIHVCNTGNPGMATAGSGDVLTGIIAGLLAQQLPSEQAAFAGAYIHGLAGDVAKNKKTEMGLIASDIVDYLPEALMDIGA